ncbi:MAG: type II secretion system F family protein [Patescibacteria group bacterium]
MAESLKKRKGFLEMDISILGVNLGEKVIFSKHLAVMLRSGMPITEAFDISIDATQGKLKKILKGIRLSIQAGHSLSDSFANYPKTFSELFINVTRAGEKSGTLVENLENIAEELRKEKELISKIKGALLYPIIVLIATFALGMVLAFVVLPKITPLFEGLKIDLPATTRSLIWLSNVIQDHGFYIFWGIVAFFIFIAWLIRQEFSKPVTHLIMIRVPILRTLIRNANLARFSRTLGMLIKSGVNIDEALNITKATMGNYYFRRAIGNVAHRASMGVKLTDGLEESSDLFPKLFTRMVHVGEESGKFEDTLFYLATLYEAEVDTSTKSLSTALEPMLLIFIGLVVGFLALSIITPIYNVTGNIKR